MNLLVQDVISCYVCETSYHFSTQIEEHTLTDWNSHIFKQLNNSTNCKNYYTPNCFKILDLAKTTYTLELKEVIDIQDRNLEFSISTPFSVHNYHLIPQHTL